MRHSIDVADGGAGNKNVTSARRRLSCMERIAECYCDRTDSNPLLPHPPQQVQLRERPVSGGAHVQACRRSFSAPRHYAVPGTVRFE